MDTLAEGLKGAKGVVFANFQGLNTKETDELRALCKGMGITYMVTKKTLLKKALSTAGFDVDTKTYSGGIAVAMGATDEVAPAQIMAKFAKTHELATIFGGILDGMLIDGARVQALSLLPSKQQLLGQLVGTLNAPVSGFVNVLAGNLRGLVTALHAIQEKKTA